jgi:exopolysaccharide biosynthesis polyprenyl glycosylphosphotransferase
VGDLVVTTAVSSVGFCVAGAASPVVPALLAVAVLVNAKIVGLYDQDDLRIHKTTLDDCPALASVVAHVLLAYVALALVAGKHSAIGPNLVGTWAGLLALLLLGRWTTRRLLERWCGAERCLVIGSADAARQFQLRTEHNGAVDVVGGEPLAVLLGGAGRLKRVVERLHVDRLVIVIPPRSTPEELHEAIRRSKQSGARVSILPNTGVLTGRGGGVDDLAGTVLLGVRRFRPTRSNRLLKRTLDLAIGVPLAVATLPAVLVLGLGVRLGSPGPAIYRQIRVGRQGQHFTVYKLRSMVADAEAQRAGLLRRNEAGDGLFKIQDDPRITPLGRVLRKTKLDELPQLWNVVRGDMSLVGPRPLVLEEDERIGGLDRLRLDLTPGVTGPWQLMGSGKRRVSLEDMLKLDYVYVTEWSLWTDVVILIRTVKLVVSRAGV